MNFKDYKLVHEVEEDGKVLIILINYHGDLAVVWYDIGNKGDEINADGSYPHGASFLRHHSHSRLTYNEAKEIHQFVKEKMNDN